MKIIDEVIAAAKKAGLKSVPGDEIFKLYDTYGFPIDLARDIATDNNLILDEDGFHREMEMQRERARASWVGEEEAVSSIYRELLSETGKTEFAGYNTMQTESVVRAILKEGKVVKEASKDEEVEVFLDKTPFTVNPEARLEIQARCHQTDSGPLLRIPKKLLKGCIHIS